MGATRKAPVTRSKAAKSSLVADSSVSKPQPPKSAPTSSKRKRNADSETIPPKTSVKKGASRSAKVGDLTGHPPTSSTAKKRRTPKTKQSPSEPAEPAEPAEPTAERRARVFRKHAPKSYLERHARATSQRMFVVGKSVTGADDALEMIFSIVGTTGNIYKTTISKVPTCDCPDAQKGNQCKHICYVLAVVLKAPAHLQYQLAFLSSELLQIYQQSSLSVPETTPESKDGNRKPVDGDCPICFMEFEANEEIVWCRATCGNNIHKTCFMQWAATLRGSGVTCVYCRSPWQSDTSDVNLENLVTEGTVNQEGYVNVADQLGLSGDRDYSSYHPYWVSQQLYGGRGRGRRSYYGYY